MHAETILFGRKMFQFTDHINSVDKFTENFRLIFGQSRFRST